MASVKAFIRTSVKNADNVNVRFRLSDGRNIQLFHKSEIKVEPDSFDKKNEIIKAKVVYPKDKRTKFDKDVAERIQLIKDIYDSTPGITSELLELKIDQSLHPEKYISDEPEIVAQTYFEIFDEFLKQHKVSEGRRAHFRVLKRALQRYELYRKITLDIDTISKDMIRDIETFLKDEKSVFEKFPEIYKLIPESREPQPRGINTISGILSRFRTFCLWLIDTEKTQNNPFKGYSIDAEVYGTPYYISIEERNQLFNKDLSDRPQLAIQRDVFIFHCVVGCRIGDLYRLKKSSVINGAIEYIARKTKEGNPVTVRVPLNATAKEILSRYPENEDGRLLPFLAEQNYNLAIKDMFAAAELTRMVTVLNSATREEEKRPLNEIASSHLARRCFIGNLYKKVSDPNLIGSLSGHTEGSKAFARYREIDEEMKIDLVNMLD
ncbi:MAG: phage integrase SAM-like domain-containing protein [Bacteroidota bacterium]|nr:phage integrase SAM-like domain-containing protein [Bacteroidota bacterium]